MSVRITEYYCSTRCSKIEAHHFWHGTGGGRDEAFLAPHAHVVHERRPFSGVMARGSLPLYEHNACRVDARVQAAHRVPDAN